MSNENEKFEKWLKAKFPNRKDREIRWFTYLGWQGAKADSAQEIERLKAREQKLIANIHVNMIRAYPEKSHNEITAHINQVLEGQANDNG